jgi:hypothetical protein
MNDRSQRHEDRAWINQAEILTHQRRRDLHIQNGKVYDRIRQLFIPLMAESIPQLVTNLPYVR